MSRDKTILALSAALLLAGCSQAVSSTATRPQEPASASTQVKGPDTAGPSRTVLFMDWTSVYPGRVLPRIDRKTERCKDRQANQLVSRKYRKGFEVPKLA